MRLFPKTIRHRFVSTTSFTDRAIFAELGEHRELVAREPPGVIVFGVSTHIPFNILGSFDAIEELRRGSDIASLLQKFIAIDLAAGITSGEEFEDGALASIADRHGTQPFAPFVLHVPGRGGHDHPWPE